jgi:hypothetical protein
MKRLQWLPCLLILTALGACGRLAARSDRSFDEIREMVSGKTAAEVTALLGKPDTRQSILTDDERWIWWNYTRLDGDQYPPEERGQVVHLEITFTRPEAGTTALGVSLARGRGTWRVASPLGVSYTVPSSKS